MAGIRPQDVPRVLARAPRCLGGGEGEVYPSAAVSADAAVGFSLVLCLIEQETEAHTEGKEGRKEGRENAERERCGGKAE